MNIFQNMIFMVLLRQDLKLIADLQTNADQLPWTPNCSYYNKHQK